MPDDQQLLKSFSDGDMSCIDELIARYEDDLFGLCYKLHGNRPDAEDLYQQTWVKVIRAAHTYRHKSFKNWLYTICLNLYRDAFRKNRLRQNISGNGLADAAREYALDNATDNVSAEIAALENIRQQMLVSKIYRLPHPQRVTVILHYFEGLSYEESARLLKVPVGTVKSRLNAAKQKLRREMENEL